MRIALAAVPFLLTCLAPLAAQNLQGGELKSALADKAADFWVYDDLEAATKMAQTTGKPLLVSFRCVP